MTPGETWIALSLGTSSPTQYAVTRVLEDAGFITFAADTAGEALRICDAVGEAHLVVTEATLLDTTFTEIAERLVAQLPGVAVFSVTDAPGPPRPEAVRKGSGLCPIPLRELLRVVGAYRRQLERLP